MKNKKNYLIMLTAEELKEAISNEMIDKRRNISNIEVQEVVERLVIEGKAKVIGTTNKDGDLLTGELREQGLKIKNINEEIRRDKRRKK